MCTQNLDAFALIYPINILDICRFLRIFIDYNTQRYAPDSTDNTVQQLQ